MYLVILTYFISKNDKDRPPLNLRTVCLKNTRKKSDAVYEITEHTSLCLR